MDLSKLAFVDIETTGTSIYNDRIIEVGILRVENGKLVNTYSTLINPETYLPAFIEGITGINTQELEKAPTFSQVKEVILSHLQGSIFIAHNVRFDYGFLRNEFKRFGINFRSKHFCTVKLSRYFYPRRKYHNLDSIIEKFNIACSARHRALGDAGVLWNFYQLLTKEHGRKKLVEAVKKISARPALPPHLKDSLVGNLPSAPGVYIFYGENDMPLYVGKSINIKNRVLSHFSNDHTSPREMKICQQTHRIEVIPTAGELSALICEASLVKKIQPVYNRKLRITRQLVVAKHSTFGGFDTVVLETVDKLQPHKAQGVLSVFRSHHQAKEFLHQLSREHNLCHKLLGLENPRGSCFAYSLGWCKGACCGREDALRYNIRFAQSFSKTKVKPWPFAGPVAIEEKHPTLEKFATLIVNDWCLLDKNCKNTFDFDTYKILWRYLDNPSHLKNVKTIPASQLTQTLQTLANI